MHDRHGHITWSRANDLRCFQRAATGKNGKSPEDSLLLSREQLIAPRDRVPQRLLAIWRIWSPARQHFKRLLKAGEQLTRREQFTGSRRQVHRQREAIPPAAECCDDTRVLFGHLTIG